MGEIQVCYMGKIAKPCDIRGILTLICCCLALVLFYRIFISFDTKSIANHILMALCGISGLLVVLIDFYYNYKVEFYVCSDGLAEYVYEYDKKSNLLQYISKNEYHFNEIDYLQKKVSTKKITVDTIWFSKYEKRIDVPEYIFEFHLNNGDIIKHGATKEENAELLSFLKNTEEAWSSFAFDKLMANRKAGEPLSFDISINGKIYKNYILVDDNGVRIGNDVYHDTFVKSMDISNDAIAFHFADKPTINVRKEWLIDTGVLFKLLSFLENAEKTWGSFEFNNLMDNRKAGEPLSFDSSINGKIHKDYILIDENGVRIGNDEYHNTFVKSMDISNDAIAFHFADKPTIKMRKVWLLNIGVLFKALNHFYNIGINNYSNGTVSF